MAEVSGARSLRVDSGAINSLLQFNPGYVISIPGILKIVQLVSIVSMLSTSILKESLEILVLRHPLTNFVVSNRLDVEYSESLFKVFHRLCLFWQNLHSKCLILSTLVPSSIMMPISQICGFKVSVLLSRNLSQFAASVRSVVHHRAYDSTGPLLLHSLYGCEEKEMGALRCI